MNNGWGDLNGGYMYAKYTHLSFHQLELFHNMEGLVKVRVRSCFVLPLLAIRRLVSSWLKMPNGGL